MKNIYFAKWPFSVYSSFISRLRIEYEQDWPLSRENTINMINIKMYELMWDLIKLN